jgi:hypothetical protein
VVRQYLRLSSEHPPLEKAYNYEHQAEDPHCPIDPISAWLNRQSRYRANINGGLPFIAGCYAGGFLILCWGSGRFQDGRRYGLPIATCGACLALLGFGTALLGFPWTWGRFFLTVEQHREYRQENQKRAHIGSHFIPQPVLGFAVVAAFAKADYCQTGSCGFQQFANRPSVVRDPGGHRRSNAQRFVNPAEVVKRKPASDSGPVILPLFTEGIREPREAAQPHPRAQVAALYNRGANSFRVGLTHDWDHLHAGDFGGRVARFSFAGGAIDLDELRKVAAISECVRNRIAIRRESIGCDLKGIGRGSVAQTLNENVRGGLIALAYCDVQHKLAVTFNRNKSVGIAKVLIVIGPHALLLFPDERPQLITFHVADLNVPNSCRHDALALLASEHHELQDGCVVDFSNAFDARNAVPFEQETQNQFGFFDRQIHAVEHIPVRLREGLRALSALIARKSFAVFPVLPTFVPAIVTRHSGLAFFEQERQNDSGSNNPVFGASPRLSSADGSNHQRSGSLLFSSPFVGFFIAYSQSFKFSTFIKSSNHLVDCCHGILVFVQVECRRSHNRTNLARRKWVSRLKAISATDGIGNTNVIGFYELLNRRNRLQGVFINLLQNLLGVFQGRDLPINLRALETEFCNLRINGFKRCHAEKSILSQT